MNSAGIVTETVIYHIYVYMYIVHTCMFTNVHEHFCTSQYVYMYVHIRP